MHFVDSCSTNVTIHHNTNIKTYWSEETRLVDLCIRPFCCVTVVEEGIGCVFKKIKDTNLPYSYPPPKIKVTHPDKTSTLHNFTHSKTAKTPVKNKVFSDSSLISTVVTFSNHN